MNHKNSRAFPSFYLLYASNERRVNRKSQDLFHQLYLFTQERMKVICALARNKNFLIWETCWIFNILMFHVIIFNNQNQLKTYKIHLQFILVLSESKIVDSTYKQLILKIHRTAVVLIVFFLFVRLLSYMLRSVDHYFF